MGDRATPTVAPARAGAPDQAAPAFAPRDIAAVARHVRRAVHIVHAPDRGMGVTLEAPRDHRLVGTLPPMYPEWLGDRSFGAVHGTRFPYVAGEMANGIATTRLVAAVAEAGMLGFFGAAGLAPDAVARAVAELRARLGAGNGWGVNLIHSPAEPRLEESIAELLLRYGVTTISASAFMDITPAVVWCSASGMRRDPQGRVVRRTQVLAKVSRAEVARKFMSPPPGELLRSLVDQGRLTSEEADLARRLPVAEDVTVEADSGGHTDNRPLVSLLPSILALRDTLVRQHGYPRPIRVGASGGLGTPGGVASAFAAGAAYVLTGSVNQAAVEAGLSDDAKRMLAQAGMADTAMAPAADMFELGAKVQVLKRGTMFAGRATLLYQTYRDHESLDDVPADLRARLERDVFRAPLEEIWERTARFWRERDPDEVSRAESDPRHRMALMFRWYLGMSSRWATDGDQSRRTDYQIWCGPAMGAFNDWAADTVLADPTRRSAAQIGRNLLEGAAVITRAHQLRTFGVPVPAAVFHFPPRSMEQ